MTAPIVFLVDNGSLRPQATLWLRCLAEALSLRAGSLVEPVSLLHSHKIPAEKLHGRPATIVKRRLRECIESGQREFICLPLFLGPSSAISDYLPEVIADLRVQHPDLRVRIADPLAGGDPDLPDVRLAQILADHVRQAQCGHVRQAQCGHVRQAQCGHVRQAQCGHVRQAQCEEISATPLGGAVKVALVDHGTPMIEVNRVRNAVARQLAAELGLPDGAVQACSMERREGAAYAFNDPLLEQLGQCEHLRGGRLILAMFFLLPGRHAGEGGDVAEICESLLAGNAFEQIQIAPLLGEHPRLLEILEDRLKAVSM